MSVKKWWLDYTPLKYESDDTGDYFDLLMQRYVDLDYKLREESDLSYAWSKRAFMPESDEEMAEALVCIKNVVRNFVRIHGVPMDTDIRIVEISGAGGAAGFERIKKFEKPYILLDKKVFNLKEVAPTEILDVYCGIGLHEAEHIISTREFYSYGEKLSERAVLWANLLEDERIEELARKRSPGFSCYLMAMKRALFERKEFKVDFEFLSDRDKIFHLAFGFIRSPYLIENTHKEWTSITSRNLFKEFRATLKRIPTMESQVRASTHQIDDLISSFLRDYDDAADHKEDYSGETLERLEGYIDAKKKDKLFRELMEQAKRSEKSLEDHLKRSEGYFRDMIKEGGKCEDSVSLSKVKEIIKKMRAAREGERFSEIELEVIVERMEEAAEGASPEESAAIDSLIREKFEEKEVKSTALSESALGGKRRTAWKYMDSGAQNEKNYRVVLAHVSPHVSAARALFNFRMGTYKHTDTEKKEGRLHRRRLPLANFTDRVFYQTYETRDTGISICLLLDESGSMGSFRNRIEESRICRALQVAVLYEKALQRVPGVQLEIYSFSSFGPGESDNLMKYLYGVENKKPSSIGGYSGGAQNYDHLAIRAATSKFLKNTTNEFKLMIVVSDGSPCGDGYGGRQAEKATAESVKEARAHGVEVVQIAICAGMKKASERMFGSGKVIEFTDMSSLLKDMRKLLTKVIKQTTTH